MAFFSPFVAHRTSVFIPRSAGGKSIKYQVKREGNSPFHPLRYDVFFVCVLLALSVSPPIRDYYIKIRAKG